MVTENTKSNTVKLALLGETEYVSFSAFLEAANDVRDMLRALGPAVSPSEGADVEWAIVNSYVGSFHLEIAPVSNAVVGASVAHAFVEGMKAIEQRAERPALFDDYLLDKAKHLSSISNRDDVARMMVSSGNSEVHINQHIAANVDTLIGVRYEEIGAVEGRIEGVNVHRRNVFSMYEFMNERRVECFFGDELYDEVIAALRKRAIVYGTVKTNARGEPLSVRAERIERLRSRNELPSISDLRGIDPDFTGGVDAAEYVRVIRDGT